MVASFGVNPLLVIPLLLAIGVGILAAVSIVVQLLLLPFAYLRRTIDESADNVCQRETSTQVKSGPRDIDIVVAAADSALSSEPNSTIMFPSPTVDDCDLAGLSGLTELKWLLLDNTNVSDAGLLFLYRLTKLRRLYVRGSRVTAAGIERLKRVLPDVVVLH